MSDCAAFNMWNTKHQNVVVRWLYSQMARNEINATERRASPWLYGRQGKCHLQRPPCLYSFHRSVALTRIHRMAVPPDKLGSCLFPCLLHLSVQLSSLWKLTSLSLSAASRRRCCCRCPQHDRSYKILYPRHDYVLMLCVSNIECCTIWRVHLFRLMRVFN